MIGLQENSGKSLSITSLKALEAFRAFRATPSVSDGSALEALHRGFWSSYLISTL